MVFEAVVVLGVDYDHVGLGDFPVAQVRLQPDLIPGS